MVFLLSACVPNIAIDNTAVQSETAAPTKQPVVSTPEPEVEPTPIFKPTPPPTVTPVPTPIPTAPTLPTAPVTPIIELKEVSGIFYTTQNVNVRSGPGTTHRIVDSLNAGDEIETDAEYPNWKRIKGSSLWVHAAYLTSEKPAPPPSLDTLNVEVNTIMSNYGCPTANVIFDDARLGEVANGKADWTANTVLIRSTTAKERLNYVVAHECMHLRQYDAYGGDTGQMEKDMNQIYGGVNFEGLEQNADCMTQQMGISVYSYTTKCKGDRGKAAATVLAGKPAL